jgi:hypothetical protein
MGAIIKYILLSILISYLLKLVLAAFSGPDKSNDNQQNQSSAPQNSSKKFSDKLGEYTDYEEIK